MLVDKHFLCSMCLPSWTCTLLTWWKPRAGAADGYKDETDQRASQLRLSDIGVDFVQNIKMKDIEACARFVKSNPVLLDEAEADQKYSTLAMKAFKQGAQAQGRNCIVKGRMVIHCSKLSRGDITKFFRSLEKRESSMAKRFYNECEGKERELSYLVQSQAREVSLSATGVFGSLIGDC